ncbi:MAG: polysaccharide biosynthesis tyrosine autokinase, partial [Chloroflexota bacterium]
DYPVNAGMIYVQQLRDTQILEVKVEDTDPVRAAVIATLLIDALIENNETFQSNRYAISEESLQSQIQVVEDQITNLQNELSTASDEYVETKKTEFEIRINELQVEILEIELEIAELFPDVVSQLLPTPTLDPQGLAVLQQKEFLLEQRTNMLDLFEQLYFDIISPSGSNNPSLENGESTQSQTTLALYQQIYSTLLSELAKVRLSKFENTPTVIQIEPATPASNPVRPRPITSTMLGIVVGVMMAAGVVFLIEYLDDRIKSPEDMLNIFDKPPIGYISEIKFQGGDGNNQVYVGTDPQTTGDEEFRSLRTNIEFMNTDNSVRKILVTSPSANEGKSTIATNLAIALIQNNKRVVLIDADLRRPALHRIYRLENRFGLSEYLKGQGEESKLGTIVDKTKRLLVIPSGKLPSNPAELLNSNNFAMLLSKLEQVSDYIIIDSPPLLVTDPVILSAKTDGVLLVVQPRSTRKRNLEGAVEHLMHSKSRILGVVFNRITAQTAYYYQYHYSNYYPSSQYITEQEEKGGLVTRVLSFMKNGKNDN